MNFNISYLNKEIKIPYLVKIGEKKLLKIGKYLQDKGMHKISLFLGDQMEQLLGDQFFPAFAQANIEILFQMVVNNINIEEIVKVAFSLPPSTNAIVAIGGGKSLDFAKYAAHLLHLPFIALPTSLTNDGMASPNASLVIDNKRHSVKATIPFGVVIDLDIIKQNPPHLIYSGIGDMLAKITSLYDWKMALQKKLVRFNDFAAMLAYNSLDILFLKHTFDIYHPAFQRSLAISLFMSGVAMEVAGSSRVASGAEHLISHALDQLGSSHLHGLQVGVATYLTALLQNNPNQEDVAIVLQKTSFLSYMREHPLSKDLFEQALDLAPHIKNDFYTILSEEGMVARAKNLIATNSILKSVIC